MRIPIRHPVDAKCSARSAIELVEFCNALTADPEKAVACRLVVSVLVRLLVLGFESVPVLVVDFIGKCADTAQQSEQTEFQHDVNLFSVAQLLPTGVRPS